MIVRKPFCPVCGHNRGHDSVHLPTKRYIVRGRVNSWEKELPTPEETGFGVEFEMGGRGVLNWRYYPIEEDIEGYAPLIKARLLKAISLWLRLGWLSPEEVDVVAARGHI